MDKQTKDQRITKEQFEEDMRWIRASLDEEWEARKEIRRLVRKTRENAEALAARTSRR
jgi:hypothetical protein